MWSDRSGPEVEPNSSASDSEVEEVPVETADTRRTSPEANKTAEATTSVATTNAKTKRAPQQAPPGDPRRSTKRIKLTNSKPSQPPAPPGGDKHAEKKPRAEEKTTKVVVAKTTLATRGTPRPIRICTDTVLTTRLNHLRKALDLFNLAALLNQLLTTWQQVKDVIPQKVLMGTCLDAVQNYLHFPSDILSELMETPFLKVIAEQEISKMLEVQRTVCGTDLLQPKSAKGDTRRHILTNKASPLMHELFEQKSALVWQLTSGKDTRWHAAQGRLIITCWAQSVQSWYDTLAAPLQYSFVSANVKWDYFLLSSIAATKEPSHYKLLLNAISKNKAKNKLLDSPYSSIILASLPREKMALLKTVISEMELVAE